MLGPEKKEHPTESLKDRAKDLYDRALGRATSDAKNVAEKVKTIK